MKYRLGISCFGADSEKYPRRSPLLSVGIRAEETLSAKWDKIGLGVAWTVGLGLGWTLVRLPRFMLKMLVLTFIGGIFCSLGHRRSGYKSLGPAGLLLWA